MAKKPFRTERFELRLSPAEKAALEQAAELKEMTVADFIRVVSVEMARAISEDKSPEDTYHAVLMSVGRVSPEVILYAATADYTPIHQAKEPGNKEPEKGNEDED